MFSDSGGPARPNGTLKTRSDLQVEAQEREAENHSSAIEKYFPRAGIRLKNVASPEYCSAFSEWGARSNELLRSGVPAEEVDQHPEVKALLEKVERLSPFNKPRARGRPRFSYGKLSVTESLLLLECILRNFKAIYTDAVKRETAISRTSTAVRQEFAWSPYDAASVRKILTKWMPRAGKHLAVAIVPLGDGGVYSCSWAWMDLEAGKLFLLSFEDPKRRQKKRRHSFHFGSPKEKESLR